MKTKTDVAGKIMLALDVADRTEARRLLDRLEGIPCYMKVGMQLFYATGPQFVRELKERGYRVFLDLKLHDIPNTVKGAAESIASLGVDMFNVHAAGGIRMMRAAAEGARNACPDGENMPLIVAVTQLTSTDRTTLNDEIGIPGTVEDAVRKYAKLAWEAGLDGVVASPLEIRTVKEACGAGFLAVTPGIRPAGSETGDQARVMTPEMAFAQGADFIVVGRPVTRAADPRAALEQMIDHCLAVSGQQGES